MTLQSIMIKLKWVFMCGGLLPGFRRRFVSSYPLLKSALATKKDHPFFGERQRFAMEDLLKGDFFQPTKVFLIIWKTSFTMYIIKIYMYINVIYCISSWLLGRIRHPAGSVHRVLVRWGTCWANCVWISSRNSSMVAAQEELLYSTAKDVLTFISALCLYSIYFSNYFGTLQVEDETKLLVEIPLGTCLVALN